MLFGNEKGTGIPDEIKNAGTFELDAEKAIHGSQHQRKEYSCLRKCENREKKSYSYHANVTQLPKPQGSLGSEIVRVDIQFKSPPKV